jgi:phage shock protein PspC (stress-responsive transcriptional regulator)
MVDMSNLGGGKRLERKLEGRWLAGVCAGFADYFGLDVALIRVIFAVVTLAYGLGLIIYVASWVIIPEQGEAQSIAERLIGKGRP